MQNQHVKLYYVQLQANFCEVIVFQSGMHRMWGGGETTFPKSNFPQIPKWKNFQNPNFSEYLFEKWGPPGVASLYTPVVFHAN